MAGDDEACALLTARTLLESKPSLYSWHIKIYSLRPIGETLHICTHNELEGSESVLTHVFYSSQFCTQFKIKSRF